MIIIVRGLPGSGKTTIANKLGKYIGAQVLSTDKIRKEMFKYPTYTQEEMGKVYDKMFSTAKLLHSHKVDCILDATFIDESGDSTPGIKKSLGVDSGHIFIIECMCSEELALSRIKSRKNDYSDADISVYRNMKQKYKVAKSAQIIADTSKDVNFVVNTIITLLY